MINISINSENDKIIEIINQTDFYKIITENNNNTQLNYSNYIINIKTSVNSFTLDNFWGLTNSISNDGIFIFLILFCLIIIFVSIKVIKNFGR